MQLESNNPMDSSLDAVASTRTMTLAWLRHAAIALGLWVLACLAYFDTAASIVTTWIESETYNHGFLILPIMLWLVWDRRRLLLTMDPSFSLLAVAGIMGAGLAWYAGRLAYVQIVQQFAFVGLLIALCWFSIGNRAARELAFPLLFLFFAVPFGDALVPPLMELTATQTVELVRLTGIPVYREGLYFSLPTGNWSVVKACSGIRYVIASLSLGAVYAYLNYRSTWRRLLFMLAALVVPVIANVLRAYGIVMIGHLSGMKLATGVDHLIYGWVFFGLVMFVLFWIGGRFSDVHGQEPSEPNPSAKGTLGVPDKRSTSAVGIALAVCGVVLFPLAVSAIEHRAVSLPDQGVDITLSTTEWQPLVTPPWSWRPPMFGADSVVHRYYQRDERVYGVSVGVYAQQAQGKEMISYRNGVVARDTRDWRVRKRRDTDVDAPGGSLAVQAAEIAGEGIALDVYTWYRVGDLETDSRYLAKATEVLDAASFRQTLSARVLVYAQVQPGDADDDNGELNAFLRDIKPDIDGAISRYAAALR